MIEVTFLGTGAALPAPGQTNAAYLVRGDGLALLIDCGPCVLQQLARVGVSPGDVTHLFVTHRHGDHCLGFPMFALWWKLNRGDSPPPTLLGSRLTLDTLRLLWSGVYGDLPPGWFPEAELPLDAPGNAELAGVGFRTWPMDHSAFAPVLGLRLELGRSVLAFTGDTRQCAAVADLARGADLLVHDANFAATVEPVRADDGPYHATARQAGRQAEAAGARRLALVHIGAEYAGRHADLAAEAETTFGGRVDAPAEADSWLFT
jgi:ribonuclease BN (tRNA processing enzyme)